MLDMCSLCTNILQEEEIEIVCRHYEERYQSNLLIPTSYIFGGLNATYFRRKLIQIQLQTLRTNTRHLQWAMGTNMAVHAFSVIFHGSL